MIHQLISRLSHNKTYNKWPQTFPGNSRQAVLSFHDDLLRKIAHFDPNIELITPPNNKAVIYDKQQENLLCEATVIVERCLNLNFYAKISSDKWNCVLRTTLIRKPTTQSYTYFIDGIEQTPTKYHQLTAMRVIIKALTKGLRNQLSKLSSLTDENP